jgi:hypothetical protein
MCPKSVHPETEEDPSGNTQAPYSGIDGEINQRAASHLPSKFRRFEPEI